MFVPDRRKHEEGVVSFMEKETFIKDIAVEWYGGIVRGFRSKQEAKQFIKHICKKQHQTSNIPYINIRHLQIQRRVANRENRVFTSDSMQFKGKTI